MEKIRNDINGWLVVDKPVNMGSTDVVRELKHLMHPMKIGHGGTLDPFASGVLPIALGKATRTVSYAMDGLKTYEFIIRFGVQTATDDLDGDVIATNEMRPTAEQIESVLPRFIGDIDQMPPAYSALKVNGKRAYDLIRNGIQPDLKSRKIHVESLRLTDVISADEMRFEVVCGKGTYVRSLGRDIASAVGCLGHLSFLRRTACGAFTIKDAFLLDKIKDLWYKDELVGRLYSIQTVLSDILELALTEEQARFLSHGQSLKAPDGVKQGMTYKATLNGLLVAFVLVDGNLIRPTKVFKQFN
ncbi:MAG: tRNA pseudouridine(55) synthase TruB [Alphaproteobacteria bacterium]|nr:tRNA pseudouridine(55) synthase TruB [Alphaproteobacteria bacterium]